MDKCFSGCRIFAEALDNCISIEIRSSSVKSHDKLEKCIGSVEIFCDGDSLSAIPVKSFLSEGVSDGEVFLGKTIVFPGFYDSTREYLVVVWWKGMKIVRPIAIGRTK